MVSGRARLHRRGSVCVGVTVVSWVVVGDGGDRERGWVMVFLSLPDHWPPSPSPAVASYSLRYQSSYHKRFARPWSTLALMRRESNLNMNSFLPPLLSAAIIYSYTVSGSELIRSRSSYVDWNGELNTPKWEVKCFELFLQTPAVGKPNEFVCDRVKQVFYTKILFSLEKLVS